MTRSTRACGSRRGPLLTPTAQPRRHGRRVATPSTSTGGRSHPSDDLMTDLLNAEFEEYRRTCESCRETRSSTTSAPRRRRQRDHHRLIGWAGKVLAEHPDQRRELAEDRGLVPGAIEELLRYESPRRCRPATSPARWSTTRSGSPRAACSVNERRRQPGRAQIRPSRPLRRPSPAATALAFGYGIHFCLGASSPASRVASPSKRSWSPSPRWDVDWDNAVQAHTSTVRGWESLPVSVGSSTAPSAADGATHAIAGARTTNTGLGTSSFPACGPLALRLPRHLPRHWTYDPM